MKKTSSILLVLFMCMFWAFRLIITFMYSKSIDFFIKPINITTELILLFAVLFSIILVIKRNIFGGIIYAISNVYYYGGYVLNLMINNQIKNMNDEILVNLFVTCIAFLLSFLVLLDLVLTRKMGGSKNEKDTNWFYKDKKYDRELDERADKNQYKMGE